MELEEALKLIENQKAEIEKGNAEVEAMKSKLDELLGETKKAKAKAKEEADAAAKALADKALEEGNFEQLLKSSEEERKKAAAELESLRANINKEKVSSESLKLAGELADGHNATLLSDFISRRLEYTDEGLKVLDSNGKLTISTIDDLKKEFIADERYQSLVRGNQASGGGATGGKGGADTANPFKRGEHFNLTKQAEILKSDPARAAALKASA